MSSGSSNLRRLVQVCCRYAAWTLLCLSSVAMSDPTYDGNVLTGGYLSLEKFSEPQNNGSMSNDVTTYSSRFSLDINHLTDSDLETNIDLRDTNDFFDKLDTQNLQLTDSNHFQLYQLYLKNKRNHGFYWELGRFAIPEAGSVFTDGVETGMAWSPAWRTSLFGGLNPKPVDQTYVQFNSNAQVAGLYNVYQPKYDTWRRSFYLSNALVMNESQGHLDRTYFFTDSVYQWDTGNMVSVLLYLDFVPDVYIQTGNINYHQQILPALSSTVNLLSVDAIQFQWQQNILETIAPSTYREASLDLRQKVSDTVLLDYSARDGYRTADDLSLEEVSAGVILPRLFDRHFQFRDSLVYRHDFTTIDELDRLGLDWFSNSWELNLTEDFGLRYETGGNLMHEAITELDVSRYFSRSLYGTLSLEQGHDESVDIYSGFVKIGYRFGGRDQAPLRSATPSFGSPVVPPLGSTPGGEP